MGAINFSISEDLIRILCRELGLGQFVETGTYKGESLATAAKIFPRCHSVESSTHYFEEAKRKFLKVPNVHLHLGDSPKFLELHREAFFAVPTLFWLDAHWCAAEHSLDEDSQTPLLLELSAIGSLNPASVILIDDARLYLCPPPKPHRLGPWPDIHDVVKALYTLSWEHRLMICNDVLIFYPASAVKVLSEFAHNCGEDWLLLADDARTLRRDKIKHASKRKNRWKRIFSLGFLSTSPKQDFIVDQCNR